jgi:hypothetical protein
MAVKNRQFLKKETFPRIKHTKEEELFFEKKKQKTFVNCGRRPNAHGSDAADTRARLTTAGSALADADDFPVLMKPLRFRSPPSLLARPFAGEKLGPPRSGGKVRVLQRTRIFS